MQLKSNVERAVNDEMQHIQERLALTVRRRAEAGEPDAAAPTVADLSERLDTALSLLRASHLERMHRELGKAEGRAILLKLLAPASTIGWRVIKPLLGLPG
jgi:hypothetical protein